MIKVIKDMDSTKTADLILDLMKTVPPKDVAILGRNHQLLKKLSSELDQKNLSHIYVGKQHELIESPLFVTFHAFLKLVVNPYSNLDFLLIRELLGLSRKEFNEIRLKATQESKSHFQVWQDQHDDNNDFWNWFDLTVTDWTFDGAVTNLVSIVDQLTEIIEVERFVKKWIEENPTGTLADYLDWLAVYDLQDEIEEKDERLKLMTIFAAKGLEWPTTIILGMNEGILPSKQSIASGDVEQERRIFYVALTRARDAAILCVRPERKEAENGKIYENPISRFVGEIK